VTLSAIVLSLVILPSRVEEFTASITQQQSLTALLLITAQIMAAAFTASAAMSLLTIVL
jgi:hypothetical protein